MKCNEIMKVILLQNSEIEFNYCSFEIMKIIILYVRSGLSLKIHQILEASTFSNELKEQLQGCMQS